MHRHRENGATIIELALVLIVIGLLLAGAVLGQNLVTNSQVRQIIAEHDQLQSAVLGFQDRFRGLPGDYADAIANIERVQYAGNGNGRVESSAVALGSTGVSEEDVLVWDHLSKTGFILGTYTFDLLPSVSAVPRNRFGGYIDFAFDATYGSAAPTAPMRHTLKTGNQIPVDLLAQMDHKIDDGTALAGALRFSTHARGSVAPLPPGAPGACVDAAGRWDTTATTLSMNCGAASLL